MNDERPIGVDLFAGAGGMSLGFEQAGFDVVAAVELDPIHAATHRYNFPQTSVIPRSVVGLSGSEIRERAGIGSKCVDVVFGGPPCQGFSLIGHRIVDDPRNRLVGEFVRIVSELDAAYFVFENVKGLTVGRHRLFLHRLIEEFGELGYEIRTPWLVLDAKRYGVPQQRERLFLLGAKRGKPVPSYPEPFTGLGENTLWRNRPGPTCRDALQDLPNADDFPVLTDSDAVEIRRWPGPRSRYARDLHCGYATSWRYGYPRVWNPRLLTSSNRTAHTAISKRRFSETPPGMIEPVSRFFKLAAEGVCNTLRAGTDSARGAFTSPRPIHYRWPRCITVREMARLHGYPDWFRFHVTKWHGARQVGNSVPPPLARAVAGMVMRVIGREPCRGNEAIPLGDPTLLTMDMREASRYWGVDIPIGRRDRKSGARKRRQEEIERTQAVG